MAKPPAFQMYAADFTVDTDTWTCTEVGIYFRLLLSEWVNGPLPDDTERLARIAKIDRGNFQKAWVPLVSGKFRKTEAGTLINPRLELEREKQAKYRESQALKGKAGAGKRWGDSMAGAMAGAISTEWPVPSSGQWPEDSSSSSSSSSPPSSKDIHIPRAREDKQPSPPWQVQSIFELWNAQTIDKPKLPFYERMTSDMAASIAKALSEHPAEEVRRAIVNYAEVLQGEEYYFGHIYTLPDFLKKGLLKFMDSVRPLQNFKKRPDEQAPRRRLEGEPAEQRRVL